MIGIGTGFEDLSEERSYSLSNYTKGALTHHLVGTDSISFALPFEAELTHSVVPPLPKKSCDFPGPLSAVVFPTEIVRSAKRMRLLRKPDGQCHTSANLLSLSTQLVEYRRFNRRYSTNCPHKPATGSFVCGYDYHYC